MAVNRSRAEWKTYGNVFDKFTINILHKLSGQGYFEELESAIAMGKEANVFTARKKDGSLVIVKIYRLENCHFNKMCEYIKQDSRYVSLRKNKRDIIFNWVQREYRNLMIAREVIQVPTPIAFKNNVVVMSLIGKEIPALQLKNKAPADPKAFLSTIINNIKLLWKKGIVHGDLSAFNILIDNEKPIFIDFSQSTTTKSGNAEDLLRRDLNNIRIFFEKLNMTLDVDKTMKDIVSE